MTILYSQLKKDEVFINIYLAILRCEDCFKLNLFIFTAAILIEEI